MSSNFLLIIFIHFSPRFLAMGVGNVMEWYGEYCIDCIDVFALLAMPVKVAPSQNGILRLKMSLVKYEISIADFAIFGALADVIGAVLFPVDTASKQLLKGLGESRDHY